MNRNADGACLVGDGTRNRLAYPPCRIGREFVAAAVFKLVYRLHQADVAFLNQVKELHAAVGVFFGNGDNQTQVGFNHFLFGAFGFAFAALNRIYHFAVFGNRQAAFFAHLGQRIAEFGDFGTVVVNKILPVLVFLFRHFFNPMRVEFGTLVGFKKVFAFNAGV